MQFLTEFPIFGLERLEIKTGDVQGCADKSVQLFPRSSGKAIAKGKEDNGMKV